MTTTLTLAHRISEGQMPVDEALQCAMQIGEALRRIHDSGQVHGAVTPDNIRLADGVAELLPVYDGTQWAITAYSAPEVAAGQPGDVRSDIFSFGAVLFQMLTGRCASENEGWSTGSPAADRLIGPCLAANPDARTPRMQRILMELKLLKAAVRRAEAARREPAVSAGAVRAAIQQLETRISARLAEHERDVAEMQRSATDAVTTLKDQLQALGAELAAAQERIAARPEADDIAERILARVDRGFEAVSEHIQRLELTVEELRQRAGKFEGSVAADLVDLEQSLKAQAGAIESARTAAVQTDDLVERVVEALESLQTAVLDQSEDRANYAVN
jgi:hypothetical protein